jgi:ATP-binding cassette subfamily B protein
MVLSPVERLIDLNRELQDALVAADRLFEIMDMCPETDHKRSVLSDIDLRGDIRLEQVTFHFPGRLPVFENLDISIPGGKTTAVIGPSGMGKSTLCQMLNGLYAPDSGRILVGDTDIGHVALSTLRRKVGYVSTAPFIFSGNVRENIALGEPEAEFKAVVAAAMTAHAHEFIEQLPQGYDTVLVEGGMNLSTGQRLRIVLARAILAGPQVLILDEVSSLLDPVTETHVLESLRESFPSLTLLLVTHRHTARHWVDHTIRIGSSPQDENGDDGILYGTDKAMSPLSDLNQEE